MFIRLVNFKVSASLSVSLRRIPADGGDGEKTETSVRTLAQPFLRGTDLDEWFVELIFDVQTRYEELAERGSGWTLDAVNDFELHISR